MIKRIKKIRNLGLFKSFTAPDALTDFAKFNLFYGWNGSGKTTLSRLFAMLGKKVADEHFADCEFEVVLSDDTVYKNNTLDTFPENIAVFNQQFIQNNLDWEKQGAKSIVVLSEEKMAERQTFLELRDKTIPAKQKIVEEMSDRVNELEKKRSDFLTNSARMIKQSYQLIDTSDKRYMNYDRTKMTAFIDRNKDLVEKSTSILDDEALEQLTKKTHPVFKEKIEVRFELLDKHQFAERETTISRLLQTGVANLAIERLKQYHDINSWVEEGLAIHVNHESHKCEFCQQVLPQQRLKELNSHFSDAYQVLIQSLNDALDWLNAISIDVQIPDSANVYEEFKTEFIHCGTECKKHLRSFSELLSDWRQSLEQKVKNVFDVGIHLIGDISGTIDMLNKSIGNLNDLIDKHNTKATRFEQEQAENKELIELHYVAKAVRDQDYFIMLQQITDGKENLQTVQVELNQLLNDKQAVEMLLANTAIAAGQFNKSLHRFLGRSDISLVYDETEKAYRMMRGDANAINLSEGEKTAIAFVYFSTKLQENGNMLENTIVVIDDPVSSFDANYLFNSYSFLKSSCENARQLFVLTHNFQYFKLIRHWILGKNKSGKPIKSQVYQIDIINSDGRQSTINNAHKTLLDNNSEYQFLFRKLYNFLSEEKLNIESPYEIANYARKLLEAFLSFKMPKQRSNFYQHMLDACLKAGVDQIVVDRVFRFINVYSHDQKIEFDHSSVDNLVSEGNNITSDVLAIVEKLDETHYNELVEVCA